MINRTILKQIEIAVNTRPVTLITGARQVGKTTLSLIFEKKGFNYVSLRDIRVRELAINDPALFLSLHPWPLIIDEIQYAPKLFEEIETVIDNEKRKNINNYGMYILTGSQMYKLLKEVSDSLAGRIAIIHMSPLSRSEILGVEEKKFNFDLQSIHERAVSNPLDIKQLFDLIVKGCYPELYSNKDLNIESFYGDYIQTYLERDVSELINVKDKYKFRKFIEVLASLTGEELVYANIAKIIGISEKTVKEWISVLEAGDIIYLLEPYNEYSIVKRITKRPKIYFADTGLAAYLSKLDSSETLSVSAFAGRFVETYIINELRKSYLNNGVTPNFYYYRDSNMNEIDLIILEKGVLHRVECKMGMTYTSNDIKSFKQLNETNYKLGTSLVICNTTTIYTINDDVFAIPLAGI